MTCLSRCLKLAATCMTWMAPPKNLLGLPGFLPMWLKHTRIDTLDSLAMQIAQQAQHRTLANRPSRACPQRCGSRWCSDCRPLSHDTDRWSADVAAVAVLHFTMTCMSNEALNNGTRMHRHPPLKDFSFVYWLFRTAIMHSFVVLSFPSAPQDNSEPYCKVPITHQFGVVRGPLCASYKHIFSWPFAPSLKAWHCLQNSNTLPWHQQSYSVFNLLWPY